MTTAVLDPDQPLLDIALDLTASLSSEARYQRLIGAVRRVVPCDAAALLRLEDQVLVPVVLDGFVPEALARRFDPARHPRLAAILSAREPVRFAADDPRPDPYDGIVDTGSDGFPDIHSCAGCALRVDGTLVGALTVDAVRPGAFDRISDQTLATLAALAAAAMRTAGLIEALEQLAERRGRVAQQLVAEALQRGGGELIGRSPAMKQLRGDVDTVAASDLTVLVQGETGVGKELVARIVHARSARADRPLVYVNCAALPETIAESELFGHVRGAFTGAVGDRAGRFELADGGTIFLDEIGELPLSIQPKLLRVLQQGELQRVGDDAVHRVDVRVLAATNRDLVAAVKSGRFRPDLYHRLAVYPIQVPPLRDRQGDVLLLAGHFLERARVRLGISEVRLTGAAREVLRDYAWPGNVRELEHVLLRAALKAAASGHPGRADITPAQLDLGGPVLAPAGERPAVAATGELVPLARQVDGFQRRVIEATVTRCGGNWSQAARELGLDRGNLHRLAKRLGLK